MNNNGSAITGYRNLVGYESSDGTNFTRIDCGEPIVLGASLETDGGI